MNQNNQQPGSADEPIISKSEFDERFDRALDEPAAAPSPQVAEELPRYNIDSKGLPYADANGVWVAHAGAITASRRAAVLPESLAGLTVSVDVSTCDDDGGNRIFARLTGETGSDGETLLAEEVSRNFGPASLPDVAMPEPFAYVTTDRKHIVFGDRLSHSEAIKSGMAPLYLAAQPAEGSAQPVRCYGATRAAQQCPCATCVAEGSAQVAMPEKVRKVLEDARWRIANLMPQPAQAIDKNVLKAIDGLLTTPAEGSAQVATSEQVEFPHSYRKWDLKREDYEAPPFAAPAGLAATYKAQRDNLLEFIQNAPVSSGVCCCGDDMEKHYSPDHNAVDMWDHSVRCYAEEFAKFDAAAAEGATPAGELQPIAWAALNIGGKIVYQHELKAVVERERQYIKTPTKVVGLVVARIDGDKQGDQGGKA